MPDRFRITESAADGLATWYYVSPPASPIGVSEQVLPEQAERSPTDHTALDRWDGWCSSPLLPQHHRRPFSVLLTLRCS